MRKIGLFVCLGLGLAWIALASKDGASPFPTTRTVSAVPLPAAAAPPSVDLSAKMDRAALDLLTIKNFSWSKGGFGTVMQASITFENKSDYDMKDIVLRCTLSAESGTVIDTSTNTIYQRVPARSTKAVKDFSMGFVHNQARRASCDIKTAELVGYSAPPKAAKIAPKP